MTRKKYDGSQDFSKILSNYTEAAFTLVDVSSTVYYSHAFMLYNNSIFIFLRLTLQTNKRWIVGVRQQYLRSGVELVSCSFSNDLIFAWYYKYHPTSKCVKNEIDMPSETILVFTEVNVVIDPPPWLTNF